MSELEKTYNPADVEQRLYAEWEQNGWFEPTLDKGKEPFAIMMPPPNVTGTLHVGHALDNTLPDMLVRRARMMGKDAIYQPGTDHASIAVHVVLDRQFAQEGTDRFKLGREAFLERAWKWKEHSHSIIAGQMRHLGISCAWQRERFTMDEGCSAAVQKVFIDLYNKGLIYRGTRLVNWDPNMQTAVSDLEVKHKEVQGNLWHLKYPLSDGSGFVTVATTRPETMLGDSAVAVHPDDERYQSMIGKMVKLPLTEREVPVIADTYVDPAFGSGVVKITPAHDFNDYEVGKRHNLPMLNVLTKNGKINENAPQIYQGLDRFAARKKVVVDLDALGLVEKIEKHTHNVGHAERDDTVLEPFLTQQWYVKAGPLAEKCLEAANSGAVNFINERDEKIYRHWLENIQDWCISRQLWWGHRIPAWYKGDEVKVAADCPGDGWVQDQDILDTWFSSALWPFSTQGWPEQTPELAKFYPQFNIMPGKDILFFWVIRMMMMGLEFMGKPPFKTIYTHAMVLDEKGQKMSKSKGNVVDPLDIIKKYGADALRFTLVSQSAIGQDIRLGDAVVEQSRNFCTKIWNATRFALMNGAVYDPAFDPKTAQHPFNQAILSRLAEVITAVDSAYDGYRFNEIAHQLYQFTWNLLCDWYLELTKPLMQGTDEAAKAETQRTLGYVLETLMRLMHPVMPFIAEEIWRKLTGGKTVMYAAWPKAANLPQNAKALADFERLTQVIGALRNARAENNIPPKADITATVTGEGADLLRQYEPFIRFLSKVGGFEVAGTTGPDDVVVVTGGLEIVLPLAGVIDLAAERQRLEKEIAKQEAELQKIEAILGNKSFIDRAPKQVVEQNLSRKNALLQDLEKLKAVYARR